MTQPVPDLVLANGKGGVLTLTLNRPEKRNAMNDALLLQLMSAVRRGIEDNGIRVIVITGAGNCFSAGRDQEAVEGTQEEGVRLDDFSLDRSVNIFTDVLQLILDCPKPTVAAVRGFAVGGGQAMSLACDFVVAACDARFGNVEMAFGFPAALNAVLLGRHLGRRMAREIAVTGELYDAKRYWELGLINRLAEPGELEETTKAFVDMLASRQPWAVQRTKALMRTTEDMPVSGAMFVGTQLNQLLKLGSTTTPLFQNKDAVRTNIQNRLNK